MRWALTLCLMLAACGGGGASRALPAADPIAATSATELEERGRAYGRAGDHSRALQYLSAARERGGDERGLVRQILYLCVQSSQLRRALGEVESYLLDHPEDRELALVARALRVELGVEATVAEETITEQEAR